jgi:hypothetical protein
VNDADHFVLPRNPDASATMNTAEVTRGKSWLDLGSGEISGENSYQPIGKAMEGGSQSGKRFIKRITSLGMG